ncbi:MAG TPA: glycosyltransferase family A protein [Desulfosporosinus sp.]|nr:glycosyltransferase family A protein [Desulfosporosinus sp.]
MIHVLIRGRNCREYIGRCIESIDCQETVGKAYYVILDSPTDGSQFFGNYTFLGSPVTIHKKRMGLGYNIWFGMQMISKCAKPDDIVALVDADDYLKPGALELIQTKYDKNPDVLVTHGSYIKLSKGRTTRVSKPYPKGVNVRKFKWRASHLKTFKFKLWQHFPKEYLQDGKGNWAEAASDLGLMFGLIELSGLDRVKFIGRPIYVWRDNYKDSTNPALQKKWDKIFRNKKPLERIDL